MWQSADPSLHSHPTQLLKELMQNIAGDKRLEWKKIGKWK
jgi:hypothetical protein